MEKELTYKKAIEEIESIVEKLENNEMDVDELSGSVKRVTQLIKFCRDKLTKTSEEVESTLRSFEGE